MQGITTEITNKKTQLIIFNIQNKQEEYALCLEFIKIYESQSKTNEEKLYLLSKLISEKKILLREFNEAAAYKWIEQPIQKRGQSEQEAEEVFNKTIKNSKVVDSTMMKTLLIDKTKLHYHIRVHMEFEEKEVKPGNLVHFQYLALLLQSLSWDGFFKDKLKRELTVFLVPGSVDVYPFVKPGEKFDDYIYNIVSQYLRMCTKEFNGVVYCAENKKNSIRVHALETHSTRKCETYFPVININADMYEKLFNPNIDITYYKNLQGKQGHRVNGKFGEELNKNPIIAMPDFITKTAYKRILSKNVCSENDLFKFLMAQSQKSIIQFCLFAFLVNKSENMEETWELSAEIERGIRQVVQNSVQYSKKHQCVFSFYLHENKQHESRESFIERISKVYPSIEIDSDSNNRLGALEIFISDLNDEQDMIDSFKTNLRDDVDSFRVGGDTQKQFSGHMALINQISKVYIRNMFSEFEEKDLKEEWSQFRKQDIVAHVGLSLFGLTAEKCNAAIKVISCKKSIIESERNYFYKAYGNKKHPSQSFENSRYIPGTQFSVLIPMKRWSQFNTESLGQLVLQDHITEDYNSFAKYLDYKKVIIPLERQVSAGEENDVATTTQYRGNIGIRKNKNNTIVLWYQFWMARLGDNCKSLKDNCIIFNHDFEKISDDPYFKNSDYIEACLKGLLMALNVIDTHKKDLCVALTNLPHGFIKSFCNIAALICVREFPDTVQLYLSEKTKSEQLSPNDIILIGGNYAQVMKHAYILSIEHGTNGCSYADYKRTLEIYKKIELNFNQIGEDQSKEVIICPFDVILRASSNDETVFERNIRRMAENPLDGGTAGYKLNDTHMRLGSKVHIEAFYEMSFLFYRTSIANRIAFLILRDLIGNADLDVKNDPIIFYGYASYSKAILTSLTEILRLYRDSEKGKKVAFASYQHNLQSDSNEIQMYFGLESDDMGKVDEKNILELNEPVKIVQIVPISSTLTTFSKMRDEFLCHIPQKDMVPICGNYTVFWVVDQSSEDPAVKPSTIEKDYWEKVENKKIQTKFMILNSGGCKTVRYFMCSAVAWHDPLTCPLCFPKNAVDEVPLVETDPTSTVPAQQIRFKPNKVEACIKEEKEENILRLQGLKDCVLLGHIVRRQNHYQYYIDTQRYFYNMKNDVMRWLHDLRRKDTIYKNGLPTLHIIFSPEHNTNVGFAQYVNTYYFGGMAEIVSINVDKEYRSNFVCEHTALKKMIEYLHKYDAGQDDLPVSFYFVDDTIITGETIQKANSFLHSLLPQDVREMYHANLFSKIFLLIDRLSNDTKSMYVENMKNNFHSFVHVDVSNIRTQGDSCVGCKLEKSTKRMFKRSATRKQSAHWAEKIMAYQKVSFDNLAELKKIERKHSFNRMMISHALQNIIIKNDLSYYMGEAYDVVLDMMEWLLSKGKNGNIYGYQKLFHDIDSFDIIKNLFKILCRPFISFDYKIKGQVLTLYIIITEKLLGVSDEKIKTNLKTYLPQKSFLNKDRMDRTMGLTRLLDNQLAQMDENLEFLSKYMFEGLTELGSTYLIRKQTIEKIYIFINKVFSKCSKDKINEFWEDYAFNIHWLLSNTKDETKELWMEYLYTMGQEYDADKDEQLKKRLVPNKEYPQVYSEIVNASYNSEVNDRFKQFILEIFLQNIGLYFDGMEKISEQSNLNEPDTNDDYFMNSWNKMREMRQIVLGNSNREDDLISEEKKLFTHIKSRQDPENNREKVIEWYGTLLELMVKIAKKKYGIQDHDIDIVLMTENNYFEEEEDVIDRLDIINERLGNLYEEKSVTRFRAKNRLKKEIESSESLLDRNGYILNDNDKEDTSYFILFFDNPSAFSKPGNEVNLKSIARVFLYMNVRKEKACAIGLRYIMRDILVYRNRLLRIMQQDFFGDTFINYARTNEERNILSHEKAASHSASTDDEISVEIFVRKDLEKRNVYKYLNNKQKAYWLLIRNYTNNQIAKLFNRTFMDNCNGEIPPLYLPETSKNGEQLFGQSLIFFRDLKLEGSEIDGRFEWIQKIVKIDISLEKDAEFVVNAQENAYNLEYFRCILVDILISAIKYQSWYNEDFLLRIDQFMNEEDDCKVKIYRLEIDDADVDYLIIENPVNKLAHGLIDWERRNELIQMRLEDPLDFADGHMSLLTIKRYVERLEAIKPEIKCFFRYELLKDDHGEEVLVFKTGLPVLRKRG